MHKYGWLIGLVIGVALGISAATWRTQPVHLQVEQLQTQFYQAQQTQQQLQMQLDLELATQKSLQQSLDQKQSQIAQLQEQLAFYEQLLPISDQATIYVRALELTPQDDHLNYKLLLQRPASPEPFKGRMQFKLHGQQNGDSVTIDVDPTNNAATAIEFDQFLRTHGVLPIPDQLELHAVSLYIYQGSQLRATHKTELNP